MAPIEVVIAGGGLGGLTAALSLRHRGIQVTVLEAADRLMARAVSPAISDFVLEHHRAAGIALGLGAKVARIDERGGAHSNATETQ